VDVLCREGQERHVARALEGDGQHPLVSRTRAGLTTRLDLASVGDVATQARRLLVIDLLDLVDAESADTTPAEAATATTATAPGAFAAATVSGGTVTAATGALLLWCLCFFVGCRYFAQGNALSTFD
jgi:hypothetical protein